MKFLCKGSVRLQALRLTDIDAFIIFCRERYARKTVAGICSTIRAYLRFLYSTGRLKTDLAASVVSPAIRPLERPHRTLPWTDVRRLLDAVDRRSRCGKRDYALLLLMSTYGLGAGEVIHLTLDDVDWQAMTLRIVRPKTGVEFMLPMMPAIAQALASYLRHRRPPHCSDRSVFVTMRVPHHRLADVVTLRHILHSAAQRAGISAPFLGTHVFRHYVSRLTISSSSVKLLILSQTRVIDSI
jgi:integrase